MGYQQYLEMVQEHFPLTCSKVVELVKGIDLGEKVRREEELSKNFAMDIYDFQVEPGRVAGAFVKQVLGISLYQDEKFIKFLPSGMAWVGGYGKMEIISNVSTDNPLLKNGIWFIYSEGKDQVIPVFPEKNSVGEYEELTSKQVQELLEQIFTG